MATFNDRFNNHIESYGKDLQQFISKFQIEIKNDEPPFGSLQANMEYLLTCIERKEIYFTGIGKNQPIAEKTANMLRSLGFVAHYFDCVNAMHGDLGVLKKDAVIVAISKSGNTTELAHMLKYVKENYKHIRTFGISLNDAVNAFDIYTETSIHLPEVNELDEWNKVPTTSNLAFQIFFDVISIMASKNKALSIDQFVKSHPGGSIGQTNVDDLTDTTKIKKVNPLSLLNNHRFDIFIKIAYAECCIDSNMSNLKCGTVLAAYIDHIDVFNSFNEPGSPEKNSKEIFIDDFKNILHSIRLGRFDWGKSPIPVDFETGKIVGGAHRLAAAIACGLEEVAICDAYANGHIGVRHVYHDGILNGISEETRKTGFDIATKYGIEINETPEQYRRTGCQKENNKNYKP